MKNWTSTLLPERTLILVCAADRKRMGKAGVTMAEAYAKASVRSEKELQEQIAQELRRRGIPFQRNRMDKKSTGTLGFPDFCFPLNGQFVGVECKVGANEPTVEQQECLDAIRRNGGQAHVVKGFHAFWRILNQ